MNEVWRTLFPKDSPARTTVIVAALARAEFLIEIECIAHRYDALTRFSRPTGYGMLAKAA